MKKNNHIIAETELILNPDGSVYHLKLKPENIAENIIVVGDQGRVEIISKLFDKILFKVQNREFVTHTGIFNKKKISVLSTGIGTDNIDIVMNELDALVNIDLKTRKIKSKKTSLNIVRIGTSGALQKNIPVDSFLLSEYGLGFDGLLHFYKDIEKINENEILKKFIEHSEWNKSFAKPYLIKGSESLINKIGSGITKGITATASGFYGPQGRILRLNLTENSLNEKLNSFSFKQETRNKKQETILKITNFEMETSAFYGLGKLLGHNTVTICAIIANRMTLQKSKNYHASIEKLVRLVLERLTSA